MPPPEKVVRQFFDSSSEHPIIQTGKKFTGTTDTNEMGKQYIELIRQFGKIKLDFENAAKSIFEEDYSEQQKKKFENLTMQYYAGLKVVSDCLLHAAKQNHTQIGMERVEALHTKLKEDIVLYKSTVESVALNIADHQLRNIQKGEKVKLDEIIPHIKAVYDKVYHDAHNPFWRWIKSKFIKSDRAKEIDFLTEISKHPQCSESIRLQAMHLVHDKIVQTEMFGKEGKIYKGSKLGKLLEGIDKENITVEEDNDEKLVAFIFSQGLQDKIPDGIRDYLIQTDEEYRQKVNAVIQ